MTKLEALTVQVDALLERCERLDAECDALPRWRLLKRMRCLTALVETTATLERLERERIRELQSWRKERGVGLTNY